jgi:voltage-gated sodium channel
MAAPPKAPELRESADAGREGQSQGGKCFSEPLHVRHIASSMRWLEEKLAVERAGLSEYLEQRHYALMVEFRSVHEVVVTEDVTSGDEGTTAAAALELPGMPSRYSWSETGGEPAELVCPLQSRSTDHTVSGDVPQKWESSNSVSSSQLRKDNKRLSAMKHSLGVKPNWTADTAGRPWSQRLVTHPAFEGIVASIIMFNVLVMAAQIQYNGFDIGYSLKYRWYDSSAEDTWTGGQTVFQMFDYVFGIIYISELLIKVHAFRLQWVRDFWNVFDALIVGFWLLEQPFKDVLTLPADATLLRTARLFKLARLVKVIKTLNGFDSLYLLITTLRGSVTILAWSAVLLLVVQMLIAFTISMVLTETYFNNDFYPESERRQVFSYFGTFSRAMLTMFEMTLANWPPVCRLLVENVNEWFMIVCVTHKLTIGFAVIGVINGVFMQETFKVAASDDSIMMRQKEREVRTYRDKMERLFLAADESGDGMVDKKEFATIMEDPEIVMWLSSMELPVREPWTLFELLDTSGDGLLSAEEVVKGALKLRGAAKSVDVLSLRRQLEKMQRGMTQLSTQCSLT